jgi:hypothetical protein
VTSPQPAGSVLAFRSHEDIATFVAAFETCSLACERWNHRAHLTIGLWYSLHHSPQQALNLIRAGIQRYNRACGWPTTATTGYHETITQFWLWAIGQYVASAAAGASPLQLWAGLAASGYAEKTFPFQYYSRETLMSWEARVAWLPPDLKPLGALEDTSGAANRIAGGVGHGV